MRRAEVTVLADESVLCDFDRHRWANGRLWTCAVGYVRLAGRDIGSVKSYGLMGDLDSELHQ